MRPFKILGMASSLRAGSVSTGLLRLTAAHLPANTTMDIYVPSKLPLFNQDIEHLNNPEVEELNKKILEADAVLFSLCEYNASVSGPLKNAIDWASRGKNAWNGKPAAMIGSGGSGSIRAQGHLRDIAMNVNMFMLNHPTLTVRIFDEVSPVDHKTGEFHDAKVAEQTKGVVKSLINWSNRLNPENC